MSKRRLGRGLDALLGSDYEAVPASKTADGAGQGQERAGTQWVLLEQIDPNPFQPRQSFDPTELSGLVDSIQQHGLLQPVLLRRVGSRFQLVAGERRLRAARQAGLDSVPARLVEADDRQVAELAIVENLQRTDLNPIEKARAFCQYLERFGTSKEELAGRLGLDRSTVSNFVRLLELPAAIQEAVEAGKLSAGHARALLACADRSRQHQLCQRIIREGLTVRQVEALASGRGPGERAGRRRSSSARTSHVEQLEAMLRQRLGTAVQIRLTGKNRGQIVIHFACNDDFERVWEIIQGQPSGAAAV